MQGSHHLIDSPELGRPVHLWAFGHFGAPVLVLPSAAGFAHEWQQQGMVDALAPWIRAGKIKLYCPESNVSEALTRKGPDPRWRHARYQAYERFLLQTLLPAIDRDCRTPGIPLGVMGCSLGGMYAANLALKHPTRFRWAVCMSGRYEIRPFLDGLNTTEVYFDNPLAYVPNLHGPALDQVRAHTHLTLVCGQGRYEEGCIEETIALGQQLAVKQIPHHTDIWGHDVAHDWDWWRRQVVYHVHRRFGAP